MALEPDPSTGFIGYLVTQPGTMLQVSVSGESPIQEGAQTELAEGGGRTLVPILPPVAEQRWWIFAAAGLLLLCGLVYLYRQ